MKKNVFKIIGIILMAAIIGFGFVSCGADCSFCDGTGKCPRCDGDGKMF